VTPDAPVQWHDEIDSTNEEARRLSRAGMYGPLWIAGRLQSAGRGRLGREWVSPTGNLYCTALFHEPGGVVAATRFPFAAGLAILDACRAVLPGVQPLLKWPNDVRVDGAKLCGILVEAGAANNGKSVWVAAGMGLNVTEAPDRAGQTATSLHALGASPVVSPDLMLDTLRPAFAKRIAEAREDFPSMLRTWEAHAEGLGGQIVVGKGENAIRGRFVGLEADGGLRLELPDGATSIIRAGDVELIKEIGSDAARD